MQPVSDHWQQGFSIVMLLGSILALLIWFPNDIRGGFIETNQVGQAEPGDAFFPIILATLILILSLGLVVSGMFGRTAQPVVGRLTVGNIKFLCQFIGIIVSGLAVMAWLGPVTVLILNGLTDSESSYRALSDTAPYKYIGFIGGGGFICLALIRYAEGTIRTRSPLVVALVIAVLIFVLDGLLSNIQLPPNADL